MTTTVAEMTALLTAIESAPWGEGDGLTGREIWGRCANPRDDGDHFTYRGRSSEDGLRNADCRGPITK